jgi:threonine synthase
MEKYLGYKCDHCGEEYPVKDIFYTCPKDGGNLDVILDVKSIKKKYSPSVISQSMDYSIWRYLPLLPVNDLSFRGSAMQSVGFCPFLAPDSLRKITGCQNLWIIDDGQNPTASLKDRASSVVIQRAHEIQADVTVTASTGNAGAALAGMAAASGKNAVILAPHTAPSAKVAQLLIFGAKVLLVNGTYDDAFDLTLEAVEKFGWYCRNTGYNPFTAEGKKTVAYEICEKLTFALMKSEKKKIKYWECPDIVFVPVGDGNIIYSTCKGFRELYELGWIEKIPRVFGVQSVGSSAIYNAFKEGTEEIKKVSANTLADSISVDLPRDGLRALRAVKKTEGIFIQVKDEEILSAISTLAKDAGIFSEPAASTAFAGFLKAKKEGLIEDNKKVVVLNTGNGLKDISAAMKAVGEAKIIESNLNALESAI